jgi:trk system potassium uptake protein TrkH
LYTLLIIIVFVSASVWLLSGISALGLSFPDILTLVVSSQSTAGFSSVSVAGLPGWLLLMLCFCMAVGGGIGSTAGGIKLGRFIVMLRVAQRAVIQAAVSGNVRVARGAHGEQLNSDETEDVLAMLSLFLAVLLSSWLVFLVYGYPAAESLFEITSALATAGLSSGLTSESMPPVLKFVLCCNMLLGRVEILAILILFSLYSWIGKRRKSGVDQ